MIDAVTISIYINMQICRVLSQVLSDSFKFHVLFHFDRTLGEDRRL